MNDTSQQTKAKGQYFVFGSGLMPVPLGRINEIPRLKKEFHASEVSFALAVGRTRKFA